VVVNAVNAMENGPSRCGRGWRGETVGIVCYMLHASHALRAPGMRLGGGKGCVGNG
jgi:hypothetical protein